MAFRRQLRLRTLSLVIGSTLQGCALLSNTRSTQAQLERVAKDWCMTIRASQVLCTYPLTEDLQVGDMYIVSTSIDDQVQQYRDRGFLPFELLLWRLQPKGYDEMYRGFYNTRGFVDVVPHQWQFPANTTGGGTDWATAPAAAFPTYKFSVQRGQGLNLAVPVQSVPVGLSLMNTGTATGSISIDDASTYGVPLGLLERQVDAWARCPLNRAVLARYAPTTDAKGRQKQQFLRVVARVYVTGKINVSLQNDEARSLGGNVGAPQPVNIITGSQDLQSVVNATNPGGTPPGTTTPATPAPATPATPAPATPATPAPATPATPAPATPATPAPATPATPAPATPATPSPATPATPSPATPATPSPATPATPAPATPATPAPATPVPTTPAALTGTTISKGAPGGSIRIAAVSNRTISMSETFARPLVIGYIAFDRAIGPGGLLGRAVSTLQRVERRVTEPPVPTSEDTVFDIDENSELIDEWVNLPGNRAILSQFLEKKGIPPRDIPSVTFGKQHVALRNEIVNTFGIGANCG